MRFLTIAFIVSCCSFGSAWDGENTHLDLLWPPPQAEKDIVVNSITISPAEVSGDSNFPCAHMPIPDNVARIDFPIVGGQVEYNLTAFATVPSNEQYMVNYYFGQFNNNTTVAQDNWIIADSSKYWNATDFATGLGSYCTPLYGPLGDYAMNLTQRIYRYPYPTVNAYRDGLEGMNATFGAELVVFSNEIGSQTRAIMNVCSYVRLTYNPSSWGPCQGHNIGTSASAAPTTRPTATSSGIILMTSTGGPGTITAVPTNGSDPAPSSTGTGTGRRSNTAIGAGVGGAAGAAILILMLGFVLLRRRRRAREAKMVDVSPVEDNHDIADDTRVVIDSKSRHSKEKKGWISVSSDKEEMLGKKKGSDADDADLVKAESSSSSIRSEPLPTYAEATNSERK